jgi:DNA-binding transcriptional ArsR family regulator
MSRAFKAIAAEPRRRILNHLVGGPMTVGEIAANFDMATPSISKRRSVSRIAIGSCDTANRFSSMDSII